MSIKFICTKHNKPFDECGCSMSGTFTYNQAANTTNAWPEPIDFGMSGVATHRADQYTLDAIRTIVAEEIYKALAEQEDEKPHIITVQEDFENALYCKCTDATGKQYRGVLHPVDEEK